MNPFLEEINVTLQKVKDSKYGILFQDHSLIIKNLIPNISAEQKVYFLW